MPAPKLEQAQYLPPPRLVKGHVWYIEYYSTDEKTGEKVRQRKTFDLNRMKNLREREHRATLLIAELDRKILKNFSTKTDDIPKLRTPIREAIEFARDLKCRSDREHTRITYTSMARIFCEWLASKGWSDMPVAAFSSEMASRFLDYVQLERKTKKGEPLRNKVYNNYIQNLRALFSELKEREFVHENPFSGAKKKKEEQKRRIAFDKEDSNAVAAHAWEHDRLIYYALLLISHCGLRISELRRMRFRDIDVEAGAIKLAGAQTKNRENACITIPAGAIPVIADWIQMQPSKCLIFGEGLKPHPTKSCGRNSMSDRFRELLDEMVASGLLQNRNGYSLYSWKDTGAITMVKSGVDILSIQKHLRHKSLATTQRYLETLGIINMDIRDFRGVIFLLPTELGRAA